MGINKWKWIMTLSGVILTTINMNAQRKDILDIQQQSLIKISALTAIGKLDALKIQLNKGLANGLTINEIKEE